MIADGFSVADKATKEGNSDSFHLGVRLQPSQPFPFNTMMVHHVNHHHLLPSNGLAVGQGLTGDGIKYVTHDMCRVLGDGAYTASAASAGYDGAVGVRTLQSLETSTAALNSSGGMAASLGFPFTNAQWKELERQAIIYKYMMASIPVPPCLLSPTTKYLSSGPAATYPANLLGSALNLRFTNGADLEPGRCRRTDGKKWRCSRDVAPDQKYCERHMNRGRPRSRKPVEVHANNKKARHSHASRAEAPVGTTTTLCNPIVNRNSTASLFAGAISRPYLQAPSFPDTSCYKVATIDNSGAFVSTYKDPRHSEWMVKGEPVSIAPSNQQWHRLVETEIGLATDSSFDDASVLTQHYQEEPLSLNSLGNFNTGEDQPGNNCSLFLEQNPKGFIDAWSAAGASKEHNTNSFSSNEKTCPSSLTLSMGASTSMDDDNETGQIQMGLGLIESDQTRDTGGGTTNTNTTPGGPLAEALQLTTFSTTVSPSCGSSPCTTNVSSPSGSLQKPLASFSDNSGSSSSPTLASSRAKSEMPLMWLSSG